MCRANISKTGKKYHSNDRDLADLVLLLYFIPWLRNLRVFVQPLTVLHFLCIGGHYWSLAAGSSLNVMF